MWLASVQDDGKTADGIGEEMLRRAILSSFPDIEQIEAEYQKGRALLNDQAKASLTHRAGPCEVQDVLEDDIPK